jgi:hypothetical protein
MATRPFKSISPQELEAAIAAAVTAITNTETTVSIGQWKEVSNGPDGFTGREKYEFQLSLTAGKSFGDSRIPAGMDDKLPADADDLDF